MIAGPALAQQNEPMTLAPLSVEGQGITSGVKPEKVESPKYTAPLLDTPQTITVIPEQVIKEQNLLTLREVLSTVPGITFGAGEGGGGYGDNVTLRGYTASTDITIDGIRDSAQYTRSDPFNIESVEVTNGSNSVYNGSGSVGGNINITSKTPKADPFTTVTGGIGTDNYYRATIDTNQVFDTVAVRVNAMGHSNEVSGRDVEDFKRWGIAPSILLGLGKPTRVTLNYFYQHDSNVPQYGVPYFRNAFNNGPLPGVDSSNYYGYRNIDQQRINVHLLTGRIEHEFTDRILLRNLTRYENVKQYSVVDPPQGTWCLASGINVATGAACTPTGFYTPSGPRGNVRDTKNTGFFNQTDLRAQFRTGGLQHTLAVGASFASEKFHLDTGNVLRNANGAVPNPTLANMNIANPDNVYRGPINFVKTAAQDGTLDNQAVYVFDTIRLSRHFELNVGARYEHNDGTYTSAVFTNNVFTSQTEIFKNVDNLFSYRAGLVYKPVENGSIYVAYGNAKSPSKTSVNGSCTALTCGVKPETAKSYEIGTKWDVLNKQLSLTAAVFRNARTNFRVASNDPIVPAQQLDGSARVDGVALGAAGAITPEWTVFANYTYLKTKILRSIDLFSINRGVVDPQKGNELGNVPDHAVNLWTTYRLGDWTVGYGANYQGRWYLTTAAPLFTTAGYWTHKAMVGYQITDRLGVQVNANNILDKEYYVRIRNNGWATPGEGRSVIATASYTF